MRAYTVNGVAGAAARAVSLACNVLAQSRPQSSVHHVEDDPRFRHLGIDLLWERSGEPTLGVEVKGDRRGGPKGNYFFELLSNAERGSPGCFLYSAADIYLYAFLAIEEVHLLKLAPVREWFCANRKNYALKATRTRVGQSFYTTVGAAVPVRHVRAAVPDAVQVMRGDATAAQHVQGLAR